MRADAKVYILTDETGKLVSVNASLKNLLEKIQATKRFSRSNPSRKIIMQTLGNDMEVTLHTKGQAHTYTLSYLWLGDLHISKEA